MNTEREMTGIEQIWEDFKNSEAASKQNAAFRVALSQYGVKEIPGPVHSPQVMKYFHECGFSTIKDDETSWCSAAMCWCMLQAGIPHTDSLLARSWLDWGVPVENPIMGDVVIYWRTAPDSWQGHVGFFIKKEGTNIYTLGGNQGNMFNITPYSDRQLLGYRRWLP